MTGRITQIRVADPAGPEAMPVWRVEYERATRANYLKLSAPDAQEAQRLAGLALAFDAGGTE